MLLFCLKSVLWTGNELAGNDVENCKYFQCRYHDDIATVATLSILRAGGN